MPSPAMEVEAEQSLIRTTPAKSCAHCERWSAGGEGPDTGSADSVFQKAGKSGVYERCYMDLDNRPAAGRAVGIKMDRH